MVVPQLPRLADEQRVRLWDVRLTESARFEWPLARAVSHLEWTDALKTVSAVRSDFDVHSCVGNSLSMQSYCCDMPADSSGHASLTNAFLSSGKETHFAMPAMAAPAGKPLPKPSTLPIFRAPIDSGCTATCTNNLNMLENVRPCDEDFNIADGKKSHCHAIGDMPVLVKDSNGRIFRFKFTNVRYVPDFKFTLISVNQICPGC